jgi:hypothetical protein
MGLPWYVALIFHFLVALYHTVPVIGVKLDVAIQVVRYSCSFDVFPDLRFLSVETGLVWVLLERKYKCL